MFVISCKNTTNCFNGLIFLYISNDALEYWFTKFAFCCVLPIFLLILKVLLPLIVDLYIIMNLGTMYRQFHLSVFQQSSLHDLLEKWCKESFHSVAFFQDTFFILNVLLTLIFGLLFIINLATSYRTFILLSYCKTFS